MWHTQPFPHRTSHHLSQLHAHHPAPNSVPSHHPSHPIQVPIPSQGQKLTTQAPNSASSQETLLPNPTPTDRKRHPQSHLLAPRPPRLPADGWTRTSYMKRQDARYGMDHVGMCGRIRMG
ncbi:hypothetical protein K402DRAFT_389947 [Aulographum hederae CBS 113979]|uniref:Uncharacterized protein n=1 Tax=Aulographum hederae CBS 113979 TaxID=1176131 RepID=A0A6G1HAT3_9PEZI|nr:hypothetical protein K402DRAFT_389947 [Aulographum hederae CBS 113979]